MLVGENSRVHFVYLGRSMFTRLLKYYVALFVVYLGNVAAQIFDPLNTFVVVVRDVLDSVPPSLLILFTYVLKGVTETCCCVLETVEEVFLKFT